MGSVDKSDTQGLRIRIEGSVQGVGFRPWVHSLAGETALRGKVWNDAGGVRIEAFGAPRELNAFVELLRRPPMPSAAVRQLTWERIPAQPTDSFRIVDSDASPGGHPSIAPDGAHCDACLAETRDPEDRRYGYPFVTCCECGPRYTIALDVPYDRERTTMREFPVCDACRTEQTNPSDRRFHAQSLACPRCGPTLRLLGEDGGELAVGSGALDRTATMLLRGEIVALKGLGGFHLACDAGDDSAVARLRARKLRDFKPFAVMVEDLDGVRRIAEVSDSERDLLVSRARPIVLLRRRDAARLADRVAPGTPLVGVMLPYSPLHALLLAATKRPLVMTSGNRSDEPMAVEDGDAVERLLGTVADAILIHDRKIAARCDDSVARVIDGAPVVLRHGRGWVPTGIDLPESTPAPVLACGAHLKSAFCLAEESTAWLGPHIGDLETHEACSDFEQSVERFGRFVGIAPEAVACDLHPDYFSSHWAERSAREHGTRLIRVQHHHAHVAAAMVEHTLRGPVLGFAWDGTGYGDDGTAWGGELLLATYSGFERVATFRPIPLPGGAVAIRDVWRSALGALDDAFDGNPPLQKLALFDRVDPVQIAAIRKMVARNLRVPRARGVGRWFDVFGAIALARAQSRFEAEIAMGLAFAGDDAPRDADLPYAFDLDDDTGCTTVDLRPALREAVRNVIDHRPPGFISRRFHATLVAAGATVHERAVARVGDHPVVLSGGCFQNDRLVAGLRSTIGPRWDVLLHRRIPPNDGGIAVGQAAVAAARLRNRPQSALSANPEAP